jgi:hypothetical protein
MQNTSVYKISVQVYFDIIWNITMLNIWTYNE